MTLFDEVATIIREVFDAPDATITTETTASEVEGWDSMSHINLIVAVEARFRFKFSQSEVVCMKNVGDLLAVIQRRTSKAPVVAN